MSVLPRTALIIGAGPAGLTAALELLERTDIRPIVLEKSGYRGGLSKTVSYKGNRIDLGGHRFFSKSDRVMNWWLRQMPLEKGAEKSFSISYQNQTREIFRGENSTAAETEKVMLVRNRLSRIYFLKQFFNYPISLSGDTLQKLGPRRVFQIGMSYLKARLHPIRPEKSLEDFFINRFGRVLYETFFKDYTEKIWGVPCKEIPPEWGAQRIKGLSVSKALGHALKKIFRKEKPSSISQKETETSLIERFLYPKLGPGQLWEEVARKVVAMGGKILHHQDVMGVEWSGGKVLSVTSRDAQTGEETRHEADFFFSTMPVQELVKGMTPAPPINVQEVAAGLQYRDFMTVGLLLKELKVKDETAANKLIQDNWIYIQEREVKVGRLQIFNNWSPHLVANPENVWIGMEYFCFKGDALWNKPDPELISFAVDELAQIGIIDREAVLDATVLREEKTYPAYFGAYENFDRIRQFTDTLENLFLVGRNGMHKYNNSDHSMLTAMAAVDNIIAGKTTKENIWAVNTEQEYHEEKAGRQ